MFTYVLCQQIFQTEEKSYFNFSKNAKITVLVQMCKEDDQNNNFSFTLRMRCGTFSSSSSLLFLIFLTNTISVVTFGLNMANYY